MGLIGCVCVSLCVCVCVFLCLCRFMGLRVWLAIFFQVCTFIWTLLNKMAHVYVCMSCWTESYQVSCHYHYRNDRPSIFEKFHFLYRKRPIFGQWGQHLGDITLFPVGCLRVFSCSHTRTSVGLPYRIQNCRGKIESKNLKIRLEQNWKEILPRIYT